MADWRADLEARIGAHEHPAWGPSHCRRLYLLCRTIVDGERLTLDDDILFACVWLHDVGTFGEFACEGQEPPECAARAAETILPQVGFSAGKRGLVARIIREHSFEGETRNTAEARVLRDADVLEFLGPIGVVRLLAIVGLEEWVPDPHAALSLALEFAETLPDRMLHDTSRRIAEHRANHTVTFASMLAEETDGFALL